MVDPGSVACDGTSAALATRHGKEQVIAPGLEVVGLCVVVAAIDTDAFGTFSGEVPRRASPLEVARRKARAGMTALGLSVGLASEGSFGPHPALPLLTADRELVVLVDDRLGVTLWEEVLSTDTVAASLVLSATADRRDELDAFCARVGFPDQALICRPAGAPNRAGLTKAIRTGEELRVGIARAAQHATDNQVLIEVDLRAHLSPSRRIVIAEAARRLGARLAQRCPSCRAPGFGIEHLEQGLACSRCRRPSEEAAFRVERCPLCRFEQRIALAGFADPARCAWCNP